jgi:6-phosphogluconolactonase (cycloisomerase 2 family)
LALMVFFATLSILDAAVRLIARQAFKTSFAVTLFAALILLPAAAFGGTGQFNSAGVILSTNGACTAASPTSWYTPAQFTGSTGDRFGTLDDFVVYLVDDAGKILSNYTDQANVGSTRFFNAPGTTNADPGDAPFKLVIFDGGALGTELAPGANISSAVGTIIDELTFDPGNSDPDCPTVDNTAPTLTSLTRQTPATSPTSANSVTWRFTFDEAVQNVTTDDFEVQGTTATVQSVTNTTGNAWDVVVSGGDLAPLNGSIAIGFDAGQNITDLAGNAYVDAAPSGAYEYDWTIDNIAPQIVSITRQTPLTSPTSADSVTWRLTWSEPVTMGAGSGHFIVGGTTATANLDTAGSSATQDVTISGGDLAALDGTVSITFSGTPNITDAAGNTAANTVPTGTNDNTYVIDNTAPRLASIERQSHQVSGYTNEDSVIWRVTFDETVSGVDATDFSRTGTTGTIGVVNNSAVETAVTISGGDMAGLDATVTLGVLTNGSIVDAAGNVFANPAPTGTNDATFIIDNTDPVAPSVPDLLAASDTGFSATDDITNDQTPGFSGTAAGDAYVVRVFSDVDGIIGAPSVSGGNWTFADSFTTLTAGTHIITAQAFDQAENAGPVSGGIEVIVDTTGPASSAFYRSGTSPTNENSVSWVLYWDNTDLRDLDSGDFTIDATPAVNASVSDVSYDGNFSAWVATISGAALASYEGTIDLAFVNPSITDTAGNALVGGNPPTRESYVFDNSAPALTSFTRLTPASESTGDDSLIFRATFDESVAGVGTADFAVNSTSSASVTNVSAATGATIDVTISGGDLASFNGAVGVDLAGGVTITDLAGNALPGGEPATDETYSLVNDTTPPRISSIVRHDPTTFETNANSVTWRVTFNEAVQAPRADMFSVTGTTGSLTVTNNSTTQTDITLSGGDMATLDATVTLAANVAGAPVLTNVDSVSDSSNAALELGHARAVTTAVVNGTLYLFAAGSDDDGVSVFSVANDGTLTNIDNVADDGTLALEASFAVTTAVVNGTTYLFVAALLDNGVSVFSVANDGTLTNVDNVTDAGALELNAAASVTTAEVNGTTYLFAAAVFDDGVSVFSVANDGTLTNVDNVTDAGALELNGAYSVTTSVVNGTTYLFVAGQFDSGISVFSVANDGTLTNVDNVSDDDTLELSGVYSVTTSVVNGTTYLFAAGYVDDGVSVFSVANGGTLTNVFNVTDNDTLRLDSVASLATIVLDGVTYLFAAGDDDDGISVFSVANDGTLTNIDNISAASTFALYGVTSVTAIEVNGTAHVFASASTFDAVSAFSFASPIIRDLASNALATTTPTGANANTFEIDNTDPTFAITGPPGPVAGPFTATFTFSEDATGFDLSDIKVVRNGTGVCCSGTLINNGATNFQAVSAREYTATITPEASEFTIVYVPSGYAFDIAGNGNASTESFVVLADLTAPSVLVTSTTPTVGGISHAVNGPFNVTVTFDEDVTGFDISDIQVTRDGVVIGGELSDFQAVSARVYTALLTPAPSHYAVYDIDIPAGAAADGVGNASTASPIFVNVRLLRTVDNIHPTMTLRQDAGASTTVNGPFELVLDSGLQSLTGLTIEDVVVSNATTSDFMPQGVGSYARLTITPIAEGPVTVDLPADSVFDSYENGNVAASQYVVQYDLTPPTLVISSPTALVSGVFTATFTFTEDMTGFDVGDITVGNGAASNLQTVSADIYTATITPAADGVVTLDVGANSADDLAGNANLATTQFSVTNDETPPTVMITGPPGPVSGDFTATFTFNETVTDFVIGDINVGNGAASAFDATGAPVYTATITPAADGAVTLDVAGAATSDLATNGNIAATQFAVTNDETAPNGYTFAIDQDPITQGNVGAVSLTFTGFELSSTYSYSLSSSGGGTPYTGSGTVAIAGGTLPPIDASALPDGTITASVTLTDAAGNVGDAASDTATKDTTGPSLSITGPVGPVSGAFDIDMVFSDPIEDVAFVDDPFTLTNGSFGDADFIDAVTVRQQVVPDTDGLVTIDFNAESAADALGNLNSGASLYSVLNDQTGSTLTITGPSLPVNTPPTVTFTFDEDVTGFTVDDLNIDGGSASNFTAISASVYTATIELDAIAPAEETGGIDHPQVGASGYQIDIGMDAGRVSDVAGNPNVAAASFPIYYDTIPPQARISASASVNDSFTVSFVFEESVTGFTEDDIIVVNGALSNFTQTYDCGDPLGVILGNCDIAAQFEADITPLQEGEISIDVPDDAFTDVAGNSGRASDQRSVTYDVTSPTLLITSPAGPVSGAFTATMTFSEDVTGFALSDITVGNGVASNFQAPSASLFNGQFTPTDTFTATITPNTDGPVTLDVAGAVATDAAGNDNTAASQFSITNDETAPTLAITGPTGPVSGAFTATMTFSEDVADFVIGDITVGNGSASAFDASAAPIYTATITPSADGAVTLDVAGAVATDAAGNDNTAASQVTVTNDETAPTLAITGPTGPVSGAFTATFTFDEDVSDFLIGDITVGNGTASAFDDSSAPIYTATIAPSADGAVTLDVAGAVATDAAGNDNTAALQFTVTNDETAPTLAITGPAGPVSGAFTAAFTFDEDVSDFLIGDITVGNGAASAFDASAAPVYIATITPAADGSVTLDVAGAVATDAAGNDNTAASQFTVTNDETAPTLAAITRANPTTELTNADSLVWLVRFDEDVTAIDAGDFTLSGTTATVTSVSPQAAILPPSVTSDSIPAPLAISMNAFQVTASGGDLAGFTGDVVLSFVQAQDITDTAGNALADTSPTGANDNSFTLDNAAPTVVLTTTATAPVAGSFTVTATFSENVIGFEASDLIVGNGIASNFQTASATIYSATITPGAGSSTTIDVASGAASDGVGNDSAAAPQFSIAHDPDRTLTVSLPGVGSGTVTSTPAGIDCGTVCTQDYTVGTGITLTATADTGSTFAGWTAGPCTGTSTATCAVTINADTSVAARFTLDTPPAGRIVAATLPGARSGYVGGPVITAFLSVVSRTTSPAQSCQIAAPTGAPVTLASRQLGGAGVPIGPENPLFDIIPGGTLSFVIAMTATSQTASEGYSFLPVINCENASLDPIVGVNDVLLNIGAAPTPDILSIAATPSGDGVIRIAASGGLQFMSASALNIGVGDGSGAAGEVTLTTTIDTGTASLPLDLEICQINASAICLTPRGSSVTATMVQNTPLFFAAFVRDTSTGGIAFDPANSRVFLRFADASGTIRSATSAAVTAPAPANAPEIASSLPQGRWSVLIRQPDGAWPGLARAAIHVLADGRVLVDDGIAPHLTTIEAVTASPDTVGRFAGNGSTGLWTTSGAIRLGGPWAEQTGEFWGVRDTRSDADTGWGDLAGTFGENLFLSETGEIRGNIGGCSVYGQATGMATDAVSLSLSGCAQSGFYLGVVDLPANDNDVPALLIANGSNGWRVER